MHCEKTLTILSHLRMHHKDVSALIKLQRNLRDRRAALFYLKREQPLEYAHVLRLYGLTDLPSPRGDGINMKHFAGQRKRGAPSMKTKQ